MPKNNIAVLFGGVSPEHEISLNTAYSIIANIDMDKYNIYPVGITKTGKWRLVCDDDYLQIQDGSWEGNGRNTPCLISPERDSGLLVFESTVRRIHLDCVFPALHGENGEDGAMQGLMQLAGIPCVGSGLGASYICMDKAFTYTITRAAGVKQAVKHFFGAYEFMHCRDRVIGDIEGLFAYPVFVKPARAGSSVGVSKAKNRQELERAVEFALKFDSKVIVEQFIAGREIEVSVLGDIRTIASVCGEVVPGEEFYSYDAKYNCVDSQLIIPAELPEDVSERVRETAVEVFRMLGCSGMARVDFFVDSGHEVYFNEINTIPGFTDISMYSKMLEASGIPYAKLIDRLIALAVEGGQKSTERADNNR